MKPLPSSARVVVIGGGIGGASAAYHLAKFGVSDVLLLERSALSSGTTWHSTGNMETYRADPLVFEMVRYAASTYPAIAAESGQEISWRTVGRVMYTDRDDRWAAMQALPELGRARNIVIDLMTPAEAHERLPILAPEGLAGAVWIPSDARVNPTDAVMAFAAAARARGVQVQQDAAVLEILVRDGAVRGVVTAAGTVSCDTVVVAAGLWSGDIVATAGARLPLYALEHQYLITKPLGIDRNLPLFLSYDDQLYGREEVGGLMVGSLDDHAIPLSSAELPRNFSFALLSERWPQFEPYLETAMRRFPILRTADIRMLLNGPESFTPDGQMLLGPVPGVTGLYSACGFNSNGMALAPAAGRYIAEWIVEGAPSADVAPLDVRRFSPVQASEAYLRERVTEIPGFHSRLHAPGADYGTARDIRRSPLHDVLAAHGAHFAAVNGWERPLWFDRGGPEDWLDAVATEVRAATEAVLVADRSTDAKQLLGGPTASAWLAARGLAPAAGEAAMARTVFLPGDHGQAEVMARLCAWGPGSFLITTPPEQETRLAEWLRRAGVPADATVADVTPGHAILELIGPRRGPLLGAVTAMPAGSAAGMPSVRWIGAVLVGVIEDPLRSSTLLVIPTDGARYVWDRLFDAGRELGALSGGHFAEEALRIGHGIPGFGAEATPARLAAELEPASGVAAEWRVPGSHVRRTLVALSGPMPLPGFGSREVILQDGRPVGELTSRVCLPLWPSTLALALLDPLARACDAVEVVAEGRRWPLSPRVTRWCPDLPGAPSSAVRPRGS